MVQRMAEVQQNQILKRLAPPPRSVYLRQLEQDMVGTSPVELKAKIIHQYNFY